MFQALSQWLYLFHAVQFLQGREGVLRRSDRPSQVGSDLRSICRSEMCLLHVGFRPNIDIVRDQGQIIASDIGPGYSGYGFPHVTNTIENLTLLRMTSCTVEMSGWRKYVNFGHQPSHVSSQVLGVRPPLADAFSLGFQKLVLTDPS